MDRRSPLLFLSHSGVDTEAARALVDRIESAPEAKARGLKVWFDQRDLVSGRGWQLQLEEAIDRRSTAFAVYVGSTGVINWVEREVRVALDRAARQPDYPFIPILGADCRGLDALPAFSRQYQGVLDVESQPCELAKLLRAALGKGDRRPVRLVDQPFVGLRPFGESDQHLFFGREKETEELLDRLRRSPLVMVVGDSGSGKSSLVHAGLVPAFRGGGLADQGQLEPDPSIWHVVKTRPRGKAFQALADDLGLAARQLGVSADDRGTLLDWIRSRNPEKMRDAFVQGSPPGAKILLVIDQFEELLTQCEESSRSAYLDAILQLAGDPIWIVITMRRDYYNLCSQHRAFYGRIEQRDEQRQHPSKYLVRRIQDDGLRRCINEPLHLAGVSPNIVFVEQVIRDVGDRPGDLALVEIALTESWRRRNDFDGDILGSYLRLGGVAGALATLADEIFQREFSGRERELAEIILLRLVRLGETGGVTKRCASRDEFSTEAWELTQRLARAEFRRLVLIRGSSGEETVELSHEALATQWPRYQTWLQNAAEYKRVHVRLIPVAKKWQQSGQEDGLLYSRRNLEEGLILLSHRRGWLSKTERFFLQESNSRQLRQERRRERLLRAATALALFSVLLSILAFKQWKKALENEAKNQVEILFSIIGYEERMTQTETDILWRISQGPESVRINVLKAVFNSPTHSQRFAKRADKVIYSTVGLNPQTRKRVEGDVLHPYCYEVPLQEPSIVDSCALLILAVESNVARAANFIVSAMEKTVDRDRLDRLGNGLDSLVDHLETGQAALFAKRLLVDRGEEGGRDRLVRLGHSLSSLVGRLDAEHAAVLTESLLADLQDERDWDRLDWLGGTLGSLVGRLDAEQAVIFAKRLLAKVQEEEERVRLGWYGHVLLLLVSHLDAEQADLFAKRLLAEIKEERDKDRLRWLGYSLSSLFGRLDEGQLAILAESWLEDMKEEDERVRLFWIAPALGSLGGHLDAERAAPLAEHLVGYMEEIENSFRLVILEHALRQMVGQLDAERAARGATRLVAAMEKEEDRGRLSQLSSSLGYLVGRLDTETVGQFADRFLAAIKEERDNDPLSSLGRPLRQMVGHLDAERVAMVAEHLLAAMEEEGDSTKLAELGFALGSLRGWLDEAKVTHGAELLLAAMGKEGIGFRVGWLGRALSSLTGRLDTEIAARGAERLVGAIEDEEDKATLFGLGRALASLGGYLDAEQAAMLAERLVANMEDEKISVRVPELGRALGPLIGHLDVERALRLVERLLVAIERVGDNVRLSGIGRALGLLVGRLDTERASMLAESLVVNMKEDGHSGRVSWLGYVLGSLGGKLRAPTPYLNAWIDAMEGIPEPRCRDVIPLVRERTDSIQQVIDLLKWPTCSSEDRHALIRRIGELASVPEGTFGSNDDEGNLKPDLWAFVDWAREQGYKLSTVEKGWLDLLRP